MEIFQPSQISDPIVAAFERLMPQLNAHHLIPTLTELEDILQSGASMLFFAAEPDAQGEIIGALTLVVFRTPAGVHAWIEDVVVDEACRGRGIGEALTRAAMQRAAELGAQHIDLTSHPAREAANRLYLRLGFERRETNLYRFKL